MPRSVLANTMPSCAYPTATRSSGPSSGSVARIVPLALAPNDEFDSPVSVSHASDHLDGIHILESRTQETCVSDYGWAPGIDSIASGTMETTSVDAAVRTNTKPAGRQTSQPLFRLLIDALLAFFSSQDTVSETDRTAPGGADATGANLPNGRPPGHRRPSRLRPLVKIGGIATAAFGTIFGLVPLAIQLNAQYIEPSRLPPYLVVTSQLDSLGDVTTVAESGRTAALTGVIATVTIRNVSKTRVQIVAAPYAFYGHSVQPDLQQLDNIDDDFGFADARSEEIATIRAIEEDGTGYWAGFGRFWWSEFRVLASGELIDNMIGAFMEPGEELTIQVPTYLPAGSSDLVSFVVRITSAKKDVRIHGVPGLGDGPVEIRSELYMCGGSDEVGPDTESACSGGSAGDVGFDLYVRTDYGFWDHIRFWQEDVDLFWFDVGLAGSAGTEWHKLDFDTRDELDLAEEYGLLSTDSETFMSLTDASTP